MSAGSRALAASCQSASPARRGVEGPGANANCRVRDEFSHGHLIAAGRRQHVLAHRDHHRGDVLAGRADRWPEDRLRERSVPPAAVVGDVVGLGGEGEEEPGGVADPGEPVRCRRGARPAAASGLLRQASRKTRWMPCCPRARSHDVVEGWSALDVAPAREARRRPARGSSAPRSGSRGRRSRRARRRRSARPRGKRR